MHVWRVVFGKFTMAALRVGLLEPPPTPSTNLTSPRPQPLPRQGGLMWFSIPFTLATSLGLAAVALDLPITAAEASEGLVPPAVAVYILGKSGAVWIT